MTSEQSSNADESSPQEGASCGGAPAGHATTIGGDVHGPVLSGTFMGPVNIMTIQAPPLLLTPQEQRNRRAMLQKVKAIWIDGLLKNSLAEAVRIELGLDTRPDAINRRWNALVQELHEPPRPLPAGVPIIDVFTQMGGALLILGAPGAGKTTLLLELARDLIARAEVDETQPMPIVFNLSTWAISQKSFKTWLVEELNQRYDVSKKVAQEWLDRDAVALMLDGLDEVAPEQRDACAQEINVYRSDTSGLLPIAVCSRVVDYEALATKLRLQSAVFVQPLAREQVWQYLEQAGEKLLGLRAALHADEALWELLDTPLMLSISALAYQGQSTTDVQIASTAIEQRQSLFDSYITAMFKRRSAESRYSHQQTYQWLSWLADRMVNHHQTVFYIERMQPAWLQSWTPARYAARVGFLAGTVATVIGAGAFGLGMNLIAGTPFGLGGVRAGLSVGLIFGLLSGVVIGILSRQAQIQPVETLRWSLAAAGGGHRSSLVVASLFALIVMLSFGLAFGEVEGSQLWVTSALSGLLVFGLPGWIVGWLSAEIAGTPDSWRRIVEHRLFRQFIGWSMSIGLIMGFGFGLAGGTAVGMIGSMVGVLVGALGHGLHMTHPDTGLILRHASRTALLSALVSGTMVGLVGGILLGLTGGLVFGMASMLAGASFGWLGSWTVAQRPQLRVSQYEAVRRFARNALAGGLIIGLGFGLIVGLGMMLFNNLVVVLYTSLPVTLVGALGGGFIGGLMSGVVEEEVIIRSTANIGIRRALRNALIVGVLFGLIVSLPAGLLSGLVSGLKAGLIFGLGCGILGGLSGGFLYGGTTVLQHYTLRWLVYRSGVFPWNPAPFLDYCTERIFLRRVGGGWIFVHRFLLEHFADQYAARIRTDVEHH